MMHKILGLFLLALITACSSPFPKMETNFDGLGESPIGKYLSKDANWNKDESKIEADIKNLTLHQDPESLGMNCKSTLCTYSGTIKYHMTKLPDDSPYKDKEVILTLSIIANKSNIKVEKSETTIPIAR